MRAALLALVIAGIIKSLVDEFGCVRMLLGC